MNDEFKNALTVYKNLIDKASRYYNSRPPELRNIKNANDYFDFVWCDGLTEEINLWTYWQGNGIEFPKVMIVGQDFGTCNDEANKAFYERSVRSKATDRKTISKMYIDRIIADKKNKTDNMLLRLTEEGLGEQYSARIPGNENLFMTNLCLGYRSGSKISGGNVATYLKHDSVYIAELIQIKKPKVVICLGMDTYSNLLATYNDDSSVFRNICEGFWESLDKGTNFKDITCGEYNFRIYGVSHAGSNGAMNRKKNTSTKNKSYSGEMLMIKDWKRIGEYLQNT